MKVIYIWLTLSNLLISNAMCQLYVFGIMYLMRWKIPEIALL